MKLSWNMVTGPLFGLAALGSSLAVASSGRPDPGAVLREQRSQVFTENRGQWDGRALYLSAQPGLNYWVTRNGVVMDLHKVVPGGSGKIDDSSEVRGHVVRLEWANSNVNSNAVGVDQAELKQDFFVGDESTFRRGVRSFAEVYSQNIYRNIHVRHYRAQQGLRYDFVVSPGGDPRQIAINVNGADSVSTDSNGRLVIGTSVGEIIQTDLYAYQPVGNQARPVASKFRVENGVVRIDVGAYDPSLPLVIDPLVYGTYVGSDPVPFFSTGFESLADIVADARGNTYMVGWTNSITFPIREGAYQVGLAGSNDGFIIRMQADAYVLNYATYFGGTGDDRALGVGLTRDGSSLWVGGTSTSTNLPGTALFTNDAFDPGSQPNVRAAASAFWLSRFTVTQNGTLNPVFARYFNKPGAAANNFVSLKVGGSGFAYLAGRSTNANLTGGGTPGAPFVPFLPGAGGGNDGFVASFNLDGTLRSRTLVGATGNDTLNSMDVNASDEVVLTGSFGFSGTQDTAVEANPFFPTTAGVYDNGRLIRNGDMYIVKLASSGIRASVFGGSSNDAAGAVAFDARGDIYLAGTSTSPNFPRTPGSFDQVFTSAGKQFVAKFSGDLTQILYSTGLQTTGNVVARFIDTDERGNAYVAGVLGFTPNPPQSPGPPPVPAPATPGTIPWGASQIQPVNGSYEGGDDAVFAPNTPDPNNPAAFPASTDGFIIVVNPAGSQLLYVDNIGERSDEVATALHVDAVGACWVGGTTTVVFNANNQPKTPTGIGQYITTNAFKSQEDSGGTDGWAVKLRVNLPILDAIQLPPPGAIAGGLGAFTDAVVRLREPAPAGGVTVTVTLSDPAVASFNPTPGNTTTTVTIAEGSQVGTVRIFSLPVTTQTTVDVRATLDNDFKLTRLTVAPWLSDFTVTPSTVPGGNNVSARVVLFQPAINDVTVSLTTSNSSLITLPTPPQVVVPAGALTATINLGTVGVDAPASATVNASLLGVNREATVNLTRAQLANLTFNPNRVNGGEASVGRVELDGLAGSDRVVNLSQLSSLSPVTVNGNNLPTTVTIPAQQRFVDFTVQTPAVSAPTSLILRATDGPRQIQGTLLVDDIDIAQLVFDTTNILSGEVATGRIRLTRGAGGNGFSVNLSTSNALAGSLSTNTVTIAPGQLESPTFTFTGSVVNVLTNTTITASKPGGFTPRNVVITVRPLTLNITLNPTSVLGGIQNSTATLTINEPAPANGIRVTMSSSDASAARAAQTIVTIPAGSTSTTVPVLSFAVPSTRIVNITATASPLVSATAALEVRAPVLTAIEIDPSEVGGGEPASGRVIIDAPAPIGGLTVGITANPTGVCTFPASVFIPAGATQASFAISTTPQAVTTTVTFTATLNSLTVTDTLIVRGPELVSMTFNPGRVRGGRQSTGQITISQPAPAGGLTIPVVSLNPSLAVPIGTGTVFIPAGQRTGTFRVATQRVSRSVAVQFRATIGADTAVGTLYLIP
jgi:hypothetical protein